MSELTQSAPLSTKQTPRYRAWQHLVTMLEKRQSLSTLFTRNEPPFTKALCFGVSRHYYQLSETLDQFLEKRPKDMGVWACLLLGIYQLQILQKPDYAVVTEMVNLIAKTRYKHAKGLVNAILRAYCRAPKQPPLPLSAKHESPWLTRCLQADWPQDWEELILANHEHAPMTLRVNLSKLDREDYLASLEKEGVHARPHPYLPSAVLLPQAIEVHHLPGFMEGEASVQDVTAQCAVELLDVKPRQSVLDACAAPGGKTCQILEKMPSVHLTAIEKEPKRIGRIHENLNRIQVKAKVVEADAADLNAWWNGEGFDRILLDAPCSATGVIRRHPDIRILRTPEEVQSITQTQGQLLNALWPTLNPEGLLLYVTCSVLKQENDAQIQAFLDAHKTAECIPLALPWGRQTELGWQCFPGEAQGDGFYFSLIRKWG